MLDFGFYNMDCMEGMKDKKEGADHSAPVSVSSFRGLPGFLPDGWVLG